MSKLPGPGFRDKVLVAVLALFLVLPLLLRQYDPKLEPFPAVIFPKGASTLSVVDGVAQLRAIRAYVVTKDGGRERVPATDIMGDRIAHYFGHLARRRFGLEERTGLSPWDVRLGGVRVWTDADRERTRQWLKANVTSAGHDGAVAIEVEWLDVWLDIVQGGVIDSTLVDGLHIELEDAG